MSDFRILATQTAIEISNLLQNGRIDLAEDTLAKFRGITGNCFYSNYLESNYYANIEEWEKAAKSSMNALEFDNTSGEMWNTLGVALCNCQEFDEGLVCIYKAHQLNTSGSAENFNFWKEYFTVIHNATKITLSKFIDNYDDGESIVRLTEINDILFSQGSKKMNIDKESYFEPILYRYISKYLPELEVEVLEVTAPGNSFLSMNKEIALYTELKLHYINILLIEYNGKKFKVINSNS